MSFRGYRVDELQCACSGTLERNRFASITKATNTAAYAGAGSEVDGVITARSANSKVSVYPVSSKKRTFLIKLLSAVSRGDALFPATDGQAVNSSYDVISGVTDCPSLSASATYLLPAVPTGTGWEDHGNAVAIYTYKAEGGSTWTYVDVSATKNVGLTVYVSAEGKYYTWNGEAWVLAKVAAYANEAGVVGDEIEAYRSKDLDRVNSDMLPANCNFGIALMGASVAEEDANAKVEVLDNRIAAGDIAIVTIAAQAEPAVGATAVYVVKAVCTAGKLTVTLSGNGGAGTVINYIIVRSL